MGDVDAATAGARAALAEQRRRSQAVTIADCSVISIDNGTATILVDGDLDNVAQVPILGAAPVSGDRAKMFFVPGGAGFIIGPVQPNDGT